MTTDVAVYPGSFDPLTNGHVDIIRRGLKVFDRVVVAVATNIRKQSLFSKEERIHLVQETFADEPRVEAATFEGLLVDYMRRRGATAVIRGLRAVSDFEYEFQMANVNRKLLPQMETLFLMTGEEHFYVSSHIVRELAYLGGDVTGLVPPVVAEHLRRKMEQR